MRRFTAILLVAAMTLGALAPQPADALNDDQKKALALALAIGLGAALAKNRKGHDSDSDWDMDLYGQPFSPGPNVVCVPKPRKCYKNGPGGAKHQLVVASHQKLERGPIPARGGSDQFGLGGGRRQPDGGKMTTLSRGSVAQIV